MAYLPCPYCGGTHLSKPKSILSGPVPESIAHLVKHIVQCLACDATFSVSVVTDVEKHTRQAAMVKRS